MPVPSKTSNPFKLLYQEYCRNQPHENVKKQASNSTQEKINPSSSKEHQAKIQGRLQVEDESDAIDSESRRTLTNENELTSNSHPQNRNKTKQHSSLQRFDALGSEKHINKFNGSFQTQEILDNENNASHEHENYEGNIKGLLRKSRKQRETQSSTYISKDGVRNTQSSLSAIQEGIRLLLNRKG